MNTAPITPPPLGDPNKADKYLTKLVDLIQKEKVVVTHTDLNKFDLSTMQSHYRVDLGEYDAEVSHNIAPETDKNFYTLLFNSVTKVASGHTDKIVLAYIHLTEGQYRRFKLAADEYLEKRRREEDAKRFDQNMRPLDSYLDSLEGTSENKQSLPSNEGQNIGISDVTATNDFFDANDSTEVSTQSPDHPIFDNSDSLISSDISEPSNPFITEEAPVNTPKPLDA